MKIWEERTVQITNGEKTYNYKFTVVESGAFQYGNKTLTIIEHENGAYDTYDTRYFTGTLDEFIDQWYDDNIRKDYKIIRWNYVPCP